MKTKRAGITQDNIDQQARLVYEAQRRGEIIAVLGAPVDTTGMTLESWRMLLSSDIEVIARWALDRVVNEPDRILMMVLLNRLQEEYHAHVGPNHV
jgi:hypothetical protein